MNPPRTAVDTIYLAAACIRDCFDTDTMLIQAAWLESIAGRPDRGIDFDYAAAFSRTLLEVEV